MLVRTAVTIVQDNVLCKYVLSLTLTYPEESVAGGAPTPVLSPARRSAAVRMGRGGTARPPEAEWSSGVAAFGGGVL